MPRRGGFVSLPPTGGAFLPALFSRCCCCEAIEAMAQGIWQEGVQHGFYTLVGRVRTEDSG
jgi:hypothetical protein